MSFNGSGSYSLAAGNPVVTGTTISSTWANNTNNDFSTAFNTAFCRDGQATATGNFNLGSFRITSLGTGTALTDAARVDQVQGGAILYMTGVAGTNTITGTITPTPSAYAAGQRFYFVPAATNTGATTMNISGLGAKNVFWNGAACVGGELKINVPAGILYDGTQFHIIATGFGLFVSDANAMVANSADATKKLKVSASGITTATTRTLTMCDADLTLAAVTAKGDVLSASASGVLAKTAVGTDNQVLIASSGAAGGIAWANKITLATEQASTSGTSITFTGIPSSARRITMMLIGVSTSGTSNFLVRIGPSGGVETSGYVSSAGNGSSSSTSTAGFLVSNSIGSQAETRGGMITLSLENSSTNTWTVGGVLNRESNGPEFFAGTKSTAGVVDRISITTVGGTDTFDAGAINISYE